MGFIYLTKEIQNFGSLKKRQAFIVHLKQELHFNLQFSQWKSHQSALYKERNLPKKQLENQN